MRMRDTCCSHSPHDELRLQQEQHTCGDVASCPCCRHQEEVCEPSAACPPWAGPASCCARSVSFRFTTSASTNTCVGARQRVYVVREGRLHPQNACASVLGSHTCFCLLALCHQPSQHSPTLLLPMCTHSPQRQFCLVEGALTSMASSVSVGIATMKHVSLLPGSAHSDTKASSWGRSNTTVVLQGSSEAGMPLSVSSSYSQLINIQVAFCVCGK